MASAQDPIIKTTDQQDAEHVQNVAGNLNAAGYNINPQDVTPVTATTPIAQTADFKQAGAEVIGEDLSHILGTTVGDLTYGVTKIRTTKSNRFLGMLKGRLFRKKNPDEEVVEK